MHSARGTQVAEETPLFRVRQTRYAQAVAEARSRLAEAELRLLRERAARELARTEWERTGAEPDPLALGVPQLAAAEEGAAAARAALETAEADLGNTEVRAPHAGLVASRGAEVGEWVTPGQRLLELFSLEVFEVRVSLPDAALPLLDLPFRETGGRASPARVTATLGPPDAEVRWTWEGRLARMEGAMDPATRFMPAVIEVAGPYRTTPDGRPPLVAGMFVRVEIEGKEFADVATVPVSAFRADGTVLVVDGEDRVRIRQVDAFWPAGETALLVRFRSGGRGPARGVSAVHGRGGDAGPDRRFSGGRGSLTGRSDRDFLSGTGGMDGEPAAKERRSTGVIAWFVRNRVAANLVFFGVSLAGYLSLGGIPHELLPETSSPAVVVRVVLPGAEAETVESRGAASSRRSAAGHRGGCGR